MSTSSSAIRAPLSAMSKVTATALVGIALLLTYIMAGVIGHFIPPLAVFAGLALLFAGVVMTGRRWAPLLGVAISVLVVLMNAPHIGHALAELRSPMFAPTILILGFSLIGIVAGIGALVQNYRRAAERPAPRWLTPGVVAVAGICLGAIAIAAVPQPGTAAGVSPETLSSLPALRTVNFAFDQQEIRVKVGETVALRLENADKAPHSFDIDEFNVHAPMPPEATSLALFKADKPGTYTFYCAPHYDKASGQGMKGTLIVEP